MALTEMQIRAAKPREKSYKLADAGGLFLFVSPAGGKLWRYKYRHNGREKLLSLGAYPAIGLKAARDARDQAKRTLADGRDPSAEKVAAKRGDDTTNSISIPEIVTFGDVAAEWIKKSQREGRAQATLAKNRWLLEYAIKHFGTEPVDAIKPATVLACLRKLEAREKYESARRLRSVIGAVFKFAVATARAEGDPTYSLQNALIRPTVTPRAAITEPEAFGGLLRAVWGFTGSVELGAALKLMALLAQRPGELRQARWEEFDLKGGVWTIPAARTKMRRPHRVPLGPEAISILKDLQPFQRSELAFPNIRSDDRPLSENAFNSALRRLSFTQDEATAHGFRASFSTLANESGLWHPDAIERALGHIEGNSVRGAYARGHFWDERVRLAAWWEGRCRELREPKRAPFEELLGP